MNWIESISSAIEYIENNLKNEFFYFFIMKAICIQSSFKKYFLYTMKLLKFHSN